MDVTHVPALRRGVSGVVLMARDDRVAGRDSLDRHAAGCGFDDRARDEAGAGTRAPAPGLAEAAQGQQAVASELGGGDGRAGDRFWFRW